jgi:hypothetical protein
MIFRLPPLAVFGLLVLGGMNVWLLSVLVEGNALGDHVPTGTIGSALVIPGPGSAVPTARPIGAYNRILAQPVFLKTRAPFVAPPPPPPPAPAAPAPANIDPGLVLAGITLTSSVRKAYLLNKADSQGTWLGEGESFRGWKVQSIDSTSAKLQQQSRTIELHLYPPD